MQQLNNFTRWSVEKKISFAGVRPQTGSAGNGLFATFPISPGTKLVQVPRQTTLTVKKDTEPVPKGASAELQRVWNQIPWYGKMTCKLLLLPTPDYTPYLNVLPKVSLPAMWSRDDIEQLQCDYMIEKVEQEQQEWQQLATLLGPWLASKKFSKDQLFWALASVRSRTFSGPQFSVPIPVALGIFAVLQALSACAALDLGLLAGLPVPWQVTEALAFVIPAGLLAWDVQSAQTKVTYAIAPFLDMMNHSSRVTAEVNYDFLREAYCVSSCRAYSPGEEVLVSYGELSNDACLQLYGFVEPENLNDRYVFQDLGSRLLQGPLAQKASPSALSFLQKSINDAKASGLLTQVPVTASGFPPDVTQFVQRLASELTDLSPVGSSADLAQRALRDACKKELQVGFPTTLDADQAELEKLELQVSKYKLEKMMSQSDPVPGAQPPEAGMQQTDDNITDESTQRPSRDPGETTPGPGSDLSTPAPDTGSPSVQSSASDEQARVAGLVVPPSSSSASAATEAGAAAVVPGQAQDAAHADFAAGQSSQEAPTDALPSQDVALGFSGETPYKGPSVPSPGNGNTSGGGPELDLDGTVARRRVCLSYRIQKKRLLAGILVPIREVRFDSRQG